MKKRDVKTWIASRKLSQEKPKHKAARIAFNLFPAHFMTGGKALHFSPETSQVLVMLPVSWRTKGWLGNLFGGKMFSATDALPLTLAYNLIEPKKKKKYIAFDKEGSIQFLKPIYKGALFADIRLTPDQQSQFLRDLEQDGLANLSVTFYLESLDGVKHAKITKVIHVECRKRFAERRSSREQVAA